MRDALPIFVALATLLFALALAALLYLGRDVFIPFALAILLGFLLAPAARLFQRIGMPRGLAALVAVLIAVAGVGVVGAVMGQQVAQLATDLPTYEATIRSKIAALRHAATGTGDVANAVETLKSLARGGLADSTGAPATSRSATLQPRPVPVEMISEGTGPLGEMMRFATPLLHPLATGGFIVVLAVFVLIQREDLRNRMIRLAGTRDLLRTTAAIDDAAHRLSRLFLTQLGINAVYGLIVGLGLWAIGLPTPILWALLAAALRFIPYVGATMGAAFPILIAIGIDPGWSMLVWTAALFIVVDVTMAQAIEPLLYAHSTGISPVAIILTTAIWTFLWGPIGLVLAGPLTICIFVLGRHAERLRFLDVLLGDRPVLAPHELFYQRMLAGDPEAAAEQAFEILRERPLAAYYDEVALPGLRLAQRDAARGNLTAARQAEIGAAVARLVARIEDPVTRRRSVLRDAASRRLGTRTGGEGSPARQAGERSEGARPEARDVQPNPDGRNPASVLCVAGPGPLDAGIAPMLAHVLRRHGLGTRVLGPDVFAGAGCAAIDRAGTALVCICGVGPPPRPASLRLAARRLRARGIGLLIGIWDPGSDTAPGGVPSADVVATSMREALAGALALSGTASEIPTGRTVLKG